MQRIAIIPARGGSKGLPGKNVKSLAGKPLVQHTIEAALQSGVFDGVFVTSDDDSVLKIADALGAICISRPQHLARDDTPMTPVVEHVLGLDQAASVCNFALMQPTSPLRNARHVLECASLFVPGAVSSVVSVCLSEHPPQKTLAIKDGLAVPLFSWGALNQNRQTLTPAYRQNGAIWIVDSKRFLTERRFVIPPAVPYIMDVTDSYDIDTLEEFECVEQRMSNVNRR